VFEAVSKKKVTFAAYLLYVGHRDEVALTLVYSKSVWRWPKRTWACGLSH
jgi:hypothetical protein